MFTATPGPWCAWLETPTGEHVVVVADEHYDEPSTVAPPRALTPDARDALLGRVVLTHSGRRVARGETPTARLHTTVASPVARLARVLVDVLDAPVTLVLARRAHERHFYAFGDDRYAAYVVTAPSAVAAVALDTLFATAASTVLGDVTRAVASPALNARFDATLDREALAARLLAAAALVTGDLAVVEAALVQASRAPRLRDGARTILERFTPRRTPSPHAGRRAVDHSQLRLFEDRQ